MTTKLENLLQQLWPELPFPLAYKDVLGSRTKQELTAIRTNLRIGNVSRLNKQELAKRLETEIAAHISSTTEYWDHERIKLIYKIAKNDGLWDTPLLEAKQYMYFNDRGLLYRATVDGRHVGLMPAELVGVFGEGELFPHADRNTEWIRLTRGLLFYYGTLSFDELLRMVTEHSEHAPNFKAFYEVIEDASFYYEDLHPMERGYVTDSRLERQADILRERDLRSDLSYRPFTRQQLLKAGEANYVERSAAYTSMVKYVLDRYEIDRGEAELMVELCADAAKAGESLQEVIEQASEFIELPSMESVVGFTNVLIPFINDTKQYILKGHSPNELKAQKEGSRLVMNTPSVAGGPAQVYDFASRKKVGRNEPCPCGSGKKHKKCCGN